jgi:primosomal protein N' (replication factor Y)
MYIEAVFNLPINSSFYYSVPESVDPANVKTGLRISAEFGRRKLTGFIVNVLEEKPEADFEIKEIERIIDDEPLFDEQFYKLSKWISGMYLCSPGEALFSMIPSGRREKAFEIIEGKDDEFTRVLLNAGQKNAVDKILSSSDKYFYLYGITGSGKTEVYLQIAEKAVKENKSVIYLVPEIALTHQLTEFAAQRFGGAIAILHSGLTPSQKLSQWRRIQSGEAKVVLGARSAVFAPVKNLALIILDEEHEGTYKAGSNPRYHARQVAMHRISLSGGKLIMGSATPSVEAWHLMMRGKLEKLQLTEAAAGGSFAPVQIIDMNREKSSISYQLAQGIRETTAKKGQVILFLNRRGFFYYYHCLNCGHELKCRHCSVSLTYHKEQERLICHYCGYSEKPSKTCPSCGSLEVGYSGFGTEKIESDINTMFPYLAVERLDRDSIKKSSDLKEIFTRFKEGNIDILLGTQIIAKGLNFPGVKLIGIIMADTSLQLPDFRSAERTFALITQVAGRTGRFSSDGKVMIQTYRPSNYAIKFAAERKAGEFYKAEIENRRMMGFPPFTRVIRVVFRAKERKKVSDAADDFSKLIHFYLESLKDRSGNDTNYNQHDVRVLGPAECPVSLIAGNYRYHILVLSPGFLAARSSVLFSSERIKLQGGVYMEIDVDPVSLM